jgi:hypothetical protein
MSEKAPKEQNNEPMMIRRNRSNYRHSLEKELRFASVDKEALRRRRELIKAKNEAKE